MLADLFALVMKSCWQGGILILFIWAATRVFPRLHPGVKQTLWWLACLKMVIPFFWVHGIQVPVNQPEIAGWAARVIVNPPATVSVAEIPAPGPEPFLWSELITLIWLVGVVINAALGVRSGWFSRILVREARLADEEALGSQVRGLAAIMGIGKVPRVAISDRISAPCVVGFLPSTILIPSGFKERFSHDEQEMALAHELAHVRRGDVWLAWIPFIAFALFYFFPPVWLARREWATDREASCDREALHATGGTYRAYGEMLLKLARGDHRRLAVGLGATAEFYSLQRRLKLMADEKGVAPRWAGPAALACGALTLIPWNVLPQVRDNLLVNPSFEGVKGWTISRNPKEFIIDWDRTLSFSGAQSVYFERKTKGFWPIAEISQQVPFEGRHAALEFGAWVRTDHSAKAILDVQFIDSQGKASHAWAAYIGEMSKGNGLSTHDWACYSGVVNIPPNTRRLMVAVQDYGEGAVWVDDAFARFVGGSKENRP